MLALPTFPDIHVGRGPRLRFLHFACLTLLASICGAFRDWAGHHS